MERLAARGLAQSGAALSAQEQGAEKALRQFGTRAIDETIDGLQYVFGSSPPAEAINWLRDILAQQLDSFVAGRGAALAEGRRRAGVSESSSWEGLIRQAARLKRDFEIKVAPIELRARLGGIASGELPSAATGTREIDAFISHASEDKLDVARPLADKVISRGFKVWLDDYELKVGMSVYATIDDGLRRCRFGVVILSPNFFAKNWPQNELHALAALGAAEGRSKILPVWHKVDHADVARFSPLLADVYAAKMHDGPEKVANDIAAVLKPA